jgi:phenylalanine-4-hydroxylase
MGNCASTPDLTTGSSEYVLEKQAAGARYIQQPYELYSPENQQTWQRLYTRMVPFWDKYGAPAFLEGRRKLGLHPDSIPRMEEVNARLSTCSKYQALAVSGFLSSFAFFDALSKWEFPTTITVRPALSVDYLPEPDIFHDVAGHLPLHTLPEFAAALNRFGLCAHSAAEFCSQLKDRAEARRRVKSIVRGIARAFWFTIEFGLIKSPNGLRAYGSGLLSSHGEIQYALESPEVYRAPFQLEWTIQAYVDYTRYQPLLFVIDSFDQLFSELGRLEQWMKEGRLNNLTGGEKEISDEEADLYLTI